MTISRERVEFSARLQFALRDAGEPEKHATNLAREFNSRFAGRPITVYAARKWLIGGSIPTQDKLCALSRWLGVTAEWLRFGVTVDMPVTMTPEQQRLLMASNRLIADFSSLDDVHQQIVLDFIRMLSQKK